MPEHRTTGPSIQTLVDEVAAERGGEARGRHVVVRAANEIARAVSAAG